MVVLALVVIDFDVNVIVILAERGVLQVVIGVLERARGRQVIVWESRG